MGTRVKIWAAVDNNRNIGICKGPTPTKGNVSRFVWDRSGWKFCSLILGVGVRLKNSAIDKKVNQLLKKFTGLRKQREVKEMTLRRCYKDEKPMLYIYRHHSYYFSLSMPFSDKHNTVTADIIISGIYCNYFQGQFSVEFWLPATSNEYIELVIEPANA